MNTKSSQVTKYLSSLAYPCSRTELAEHARMLGADDDVVKLIENLPCEHFATPFDVRTAISE